jgi:hypothetical protein
LTTTALIPVLTASVSPAETHASRSCIIRITRTAPQTPKPNKKLMYAIMEYPEKSLMIGFTVAIAVPQYKLNFESQYWFI